MMGDTNAMWGLRQKAPQGYYVFTESQSWVVPKRVKAIDVFLVGGGGGGTHAPEVPGTYGVGGNGGYTATYKKDTNGWRDGTEIAVSPDEVITIQVGIGGIADYPLGESGQDSFIKYASGTITAKGGDGGGQSGASGGSGGGGRNEAGASDGASTSIAQGQGHTTREFGELTGTLFAGGGGGGGTSSNLISGGDGGGGSGGKDGGAGTPGIANTGGGGGGGGAVFGSGAQGGSGVVIIRFGY